MVDNDLFWMAESKGKLFVYGLITIVLFFGFIKIFIEGSGSFFYLEALGFIVLAFLSFLGFIGYKSGWGEKLFFTVFFLYLVNLLLVWYFNNQLWLTLVLISLIGFLLSIPKKKKSRQREVSSPNPAVEVYEQDPHSQVFDPVDEEPVKKEVAVKTVKKTTKHSPGKFVASSNSNIYHVPKCEWAKKIKKERQLWFKEKTDAWEKGYKAHNCVE